MKWSRRWVPKRGAHAPQCKRWAQTQARRERRSGRPSRYKNCWASRTTGTAATGTSRTATAIEFWTYRRAESPGRRTRLSSRCRPLWRVESRTRPRSTHRLPSPLPSCPDLRSYTHHLVSTYWLHLVSYALDYRNSLRIKIKITFICLFYLIQNVSVANGPYRGEAATHVLMDLCLLFCSFAICVVIQTVNVLYITIETS